MTLPIILNPLSGKLTLRQKKQELQSACETQGIQPEFVVARTGRETRAAAQRFSQEKRPVVGVCGGDGSLNTAAAGLMQGPSTLLVLPGGTLNHFAQDLGIPAGLGAALRLATEGREAAVDMGIVNADVFLNNSSIGWYPRFVIQREERRKQGIGKRLAALKSALELTSRRSLLSLSLLIDGKEAVRETSLLLVANNEYSLAAGSFGTRTTLAENALHVYLLAGKRKLPLGSLVWEGLRGGKRLPEGIEHYVCSELVVRSSRPALQVACDGEVAPLRPPLHYRILPQALKVRVPVSAVVAHANDRSSF